MFPTEEDIQHAFAHAPVHLQDYIKSDVMYNAFYAIRDTYKLHVDHAGNLALAIDAVVLGLNNFNELPKLLAEGLQGVDAETQAKVVKEVNDKIFVPLRDITRTKAQESQREIQKKGTHEFQAPRVLEQKLQKLSTPPVTTQTVPPPAAEVSHSSSVQPPRYHGGDPYREVVE